MAEALGKKTVHEALKAVTELETRLMKEHQQNSKAGGPGRGRPLRKEPRMRRFQLRQATYVVVCS